MPQTAKQITAQDIMPLEDYTKQRKELRAKIVALKKPRRIDVGPFASFYFENYDTMLQQVQEMLYIEKGGEEQLADELAAYNPLIPQGAELTCTLMFEINNPQQRERVLYQLADVELSAYIQIGEQKVMAKPEQEVERTTEDGKTSSVHFLHFPFTPEQLALARDTQEWVLGLGHSNYTHMTQLTPTTRDSLLADFD